MEAKRPIRWWRLWVIGSLASTLLIVALGIPHLPWPKVEDLRAERVSGYCTIEPFGKPLVLTQVYSEAKIRELAGDPDAIAALIKEAGKNDGSSVSPDLMKFAVNRATPEKVAERQAELVKKWTPWLQRCVRKMDVDYKALRRREALLAFVPQIKAIVSTVMFFFLVTMALWIRQRMTQDR